MDFENKNIWNQEDLSQFVESALQMSIGSHLTGDQDRSTGPSPKELTSHTALQYTSTTSMCLSFPKHVIRIPKCICWFTQSNQKIKSSSLLRCTYFRYLYYTGGPVTVRMYFLLPPRSAPVGASPRLAPNASVFSDQQSFISWQHISCIRSGHMTMPSIAQSDKHYGKSW